MYFKMSCDDSSAHRKKEGIASSIKPLTSFFVKALDLQLPVLSTSNSILSAPLLTNTMPPHYPSTTIGSTSAASNTVKPTTAFFTCIRNATNSLSGTVPLTTAADTLAQFSRDPTIDEDDDDAWQMVDRKLNRIIGFGATIEEISALIRHGKFGMDGLCIWLEKCVSTLRIEVLLENKVNRLVEAMVLLCLFIFSIKFTKR